MIKKTFRLDEDILELIERIKIEEGIATDNATVQYIIRKYYQIEKEENKIKKQIEEAVQDDFRDIKASVRKTEDYLYMLIQFVNTYANDNAINGTLDLIDTKPNSLFQQAEQYLELQKEQYRQLKDFKKQKGEI